MAVAEAAPQVQDGRTVKRVAIPVVLLALLGVAACGDDQDPTAPAPPPWAKLAPEQIAEAKKHGVPVAFENDIGMRFVLIPAGTFLMGSSESERRAFSRPASYTDSRPDWYTDAESQHRVTLTSPFYMSVHEVTNADYRSYKPLHPFSERFDRDTQPAVDVSWIHATRYADWLSREDAARTYALPTEAQWEYACRAGTTTAYAFGDTISPDQACYSADPPGTPRLVTTDVGSFAPNGWGLRDMHGNALEWCRDWYYSVYRAGPIADPLGPESGTHKVLRGGSWSFWAGYVRSARRWWSDPGRRAGPCNFVVARNLGFRLISPLPEPSK